MVVEAGAAVDVEVDAAEPLSGREKLTVLEAGGAVLLANWNVGVEEPVPVDSVESSDGAVLVLAVVLVEAAEDAGGRIPGGNPKLNEAELPEAVAVLPARENEIPAPVVDGCDNEIPLGVVDDAAAVVAGVAADDDEAVDADDDAEEAGSEDSGEEN